MRATHGPKLGKALSLAKCPGKPPYPGNSGRSDAVIHPSPPPFAPGSRSAGGESRRRASAYATVAGWPSDSSATRSRCSRAEPYSIAFVFARLR